MTSCVCATKRISACNNADGVKTVLYVHAPDARKRAQIVPFELAIQLQCVCPDDFNNNFWLKSCIALFQRFVYVAITVIKNKQKATVTYTMNVKMRISQLDCAMATKQT